MFQFQSSPLHCTACCMKTTGDETGIELREVNLGKIQTRRDSTAVASSFGTLTNVSKNEV